MKRGDCMKKTWQPQPTKAVQSLINIRHDFMPISEITAVFQGKTPYSEKYRYHLLEFFNEVPPSIMKRYMDEQHLTKEQIIKVFNLLPEGGEKMDFEEALRNGNF